LEDNEKFKEDGFSYDRFSVKNVGSASAKMEFSSNTSDIETMLMINQQNQWFGKYVLKAGFSNEGCQTGTHSAIPTPRQPKFHANLTFY
jgi:hypothetical protein